MVNLGKKVKISGLMILTCLEQDQTAAAVSNGGKCSWLQACNARLHTSTAYTAYILFVPPPFHFLTNECV